MGILRTDKISGLETPTPVTGSVSFPGSSDNLTLAASTDFAWGTGDFTWEAWVYSTASDHTTGNHYMFDLGGGNIAAMTFYQNKFNYYNSTVGTNGQLGSFPANKWTHLAVSRKNQVSYIFIDGILQGSISDNHNYGTSALIAEIGGYAGGGSLGWDGYISNLRVLKGTALYTSDFTVPTHALEVIGDTVLLCCNNSDTTGNAQDPAAKAEATGKIIAIAGLDIRASTFSPPLTRDFTFGTEFNGVTTFDTQGYFVPPSGTTEQRGRGRGLIRMADNGISYITISSLGNSQDFGDATAAAQNTSACASSTRGLFSQGYDHPGYYKTIDYVTIATTGNAQDFGDITTSASFIYGMGGCASSTRGLFGGGFTAPSPNAAAGLKQINYVTIASLGDSQDFGDLTGNGVRYPAATSSPTRGLFAGGRDSADAPVYNQNVIHYVTIATLGNALDFGDLSYAPYSSSATGSSTRGIFTGGYNSAGNAAYDNIEYVTIASTGNAQDFGNLTVGRGGSAASSNSTRATFAGGNSIPAATNHIDYITIASTGDALNFGDLMSTMFAGCGCSDSHGGLS
jgi:hypothetical protein